MVSIHFRVMCADAPTQSAWECRKLCGPFEISDRIPKITEDLSLMNHDLANSKTCSSETALRHYFLLICHRKLEEVRLQYLLRQDGYCAQSNVANFKFGGEESNSLQDFEHKPDDG